MKKINLAITGCMGRMGQQIIKSIKTDKQLSNFLTTQLNTQSSLIKLTEELSKNGLLEANKVKEYFQNIEKELKKIKK